MKIKKVERRLTLRVDGGRNGGATRDWLPLTSESAAVVCLRLLGLGLTREHMPGQAKLDLNSHYHGDENVLVYCSVLSCALVQQEMTQRGHYDQK